MIFKKKIRFGEVAAAPLEFLYGAAAPTSSTPDLDNNSLIVVQGKLNTENKLKTAPRVLMIKKFDSKKFKGMSGHFNEFYRL